MVRGPPHGYSPDKTKILLVISERNVQLAQTFLQGVSIKVVTVSPYLGGFIGYVVTQATRL